ncbi:MAG: response regulator [Herminiimonas sp.]|nr:response regulator [Herminiimonas sp.]
MVTNTMTAISLKPRVLIADDSRIVRATLIKHIEGLFDFREALDGEQAWQTLLIDPNIRVVITDLTMPNLDGYGLLERIRSSKISRIRNIPVVVVSGSDEQQERDRAKAAGASDLITKGIGTAQLLSRLDILSKLVNTQHEFERSLEALVLESDTAVALVLANPDELLVQARAMLAHAVKNNKNFVMLNACVGVKHNGLDGVAASPPASVVNAIGQLLQRTIRQTDRVSVTGKDEFTLATGSIHFDSARNFAQRICNAISNANLIDDHRMSFIASCGLVSLAEYGSAQGSPVPDVASLQQVAHRRAAKGLRECRTGVIGPEEEAAASGNLAIVEQFSASGSPAAPAAELNPALPAVLPDLGTFLQWIREGKHDLVMAQMASLPAELRQMVDVMMQHTKP